VANQRKPILLRIDPAIHDAIVKWAADDLRSVNAQIEVLLRGALKAADRLPNKAGPLPQRGRPRHQAIPGTERDGAEREGSDASTDDVATDDAEADDEADDVEADEQSA
jgi:hypothetical protein